MRSKLLLSAFITILASCSKKEDTNPDGCPKERICTDVYKSVLIRLTDPQDKPYILDNFEIIKLSTGQKISNKNAETDSILKKSGLYRILDDMTIDMTTRKGLDFQFKGFKDGNLKIQKTVNISHDCCHVNSVDHNIKIIIPD